MLVRSVPRALILYMVDKWYERIPDKGAMPGDQKIYFDATCRATKQNKLSSRKSYIYIYMARLRAAFGLVLYVQAMPCHILQSPALQLRGVGYATSFRSQGRQHYPAPTPQLLFKEFQVPSN